MYYSVPLLPCTGKGKKKISIKITTLQDIEDVNLITSVKQNLTDFMQRILNTYQTNDLSECGCMYFLCSTEDMKLNDFSISIKDIPFEYCERIHVKDSHGEVTLLHGCYVLNNEFAVDIFGLKSIFDTDTLNAFKENEKQE